MPREEDERPTLAPFQIDRLAARFEFQQLADQLAARIRSGEIQRGERLPSLLEMQQLTGLSPMTIRRAYRVLAGDGLVVVTPGRGVNVR
jgi:DNA-binding GntR family transcriptional regulator